LWGTGRLTDYIAINVELLEQARSIGDVAHAGAILVRLGPAEAMRGNLDVADARLTEAEELAAAFGLREIARTALWQRGGWFRLSGDLAAAERCNRQFLIASEEAGDVQHQVSALRHLANVLMHAQRYAEAAQCLDRAADLSESSGERWNRAEIYAKRARAAFELDDIGTADAFIGRALKMLREYDVTAVSEVHQSLGVIRAAQGRTSEAETSLRLSVSVLDPTEYNVVRLEASLDLARFLVRQGHTQQAAEIVDAQRTWAHASEIHVWDRDFEEILELTT
jgi:tetratricopeptide (TPR) repeat protein